VDLYVSLLIGDIQVRLVTRSVGAVSDCEIAMRAETVWDVLQAIDFIPNVPSSQV